MKKTRCRRLAMSMTWLVFSLILIAMPCFLAPDMKAGYSSTELQSETSICQKTPNLVPNPGFEHGIGWQTGWTQDGPDESCKFGADTVVTHNGTKQSGAIFASNSMCRLRTITDKIAVQTGRVRTYHYSAWIRAGLFSGKAYLRVRFFKGNHDVPPEFVGVGEPCQSNYVSGSHDWTRVTGSCPAPSDAEYARVEATLDDKSVGTAWFDDIYLGLAICPEINKQDTPDLAIPGEYLDYTISLHNSGDQEATSVTVIEQYDDYVDFVAANPPPSYANNIWDWGTLSAQDGGTISITVRVKEEVMAAQAKLYNTVWLTDAQILEPISYTLITRIIPVRPICTVRIVASTPLKQGAIGQRVPFDLELLNVGTVSGEGCQVAASRIEGKSGLLESGAFFDPLTWTLPVTDTAMPLAARFTVPMTASVGDRVTTFITATMICEQLDDQTATDVVSVTTMVKHSTSLLPAVLYRYSAGPAWEIEPNNTYKQARDNGALFSGIEYHGLHDDDWDFFVVYLGAQGKILTELTPGSCPDKRLQLQLRNEMGEILGWRYKRPYRINYTQAEAGLYYVGIYVDPAYQSKEPPPYVLKTCFP